MLRCLATLLVFAALAYGRGHASSHARTPASTHSSVTHTSSAKCSACARDTHGRIAREPKAKHEFVKSHPCPSTGRSSGGCPGYVVDHVTPLKRGGADAPSNMQWETKAEAKAKDRVE